MNVVAVLVSADANVNQAQTDDGATPLYVASQEGHTDVVAAFVSAGADVNQARDDGARPLHAASTQGHTELLVFLCRPEQTLIWPRLVTE